MSISPDHADLPARADFDHSAIDASDAGGSGAFMDIWKITRDSVMIDDEAIRVLLQGQDGPAGGGAAGGEAGAGPASAR